MAAELSAVNVEGETAWVLREDLNALRKAKIDGPVVRLLPYFDTYLMGHKDRAHLIDVAHYKKVFRPAGWIAPVVLVNGRVAGVWSQARTGRRLVVRCRPFGALPRTIRARVEEEADDLARFLDAAKVDVAFR